MSDKRTVTYEIDMRPFLDSLRELTEAIRRLQIPRGLLQPIEPQGWDVTCTLCGGAYRVKLARLSERRICPDCMAALQGIADHWDGRGADIAPLIDRSRWWPPRTAIRYGRPWQEHVRDRKLLDDQPRVGKHSHASRHAAVDYDRGWITEPAPLHPPHPHDAHERTPTACSSRSTINSRSTPKHAPSPSDSWKTTSTASPPSACGPWPDHSFRHH